MKNYFGILLIAISCQTASPPEWKTIDLFNQKDLTGWHIDVPDMEKDSTVKSPFLVRNGVLVSLASPKGHIITDSAYGNYSLEVEYRFPGTPGNCGVLVHASTPRVLYGMFPKSIEVQLMHENAGDFWCIGEDINVPDMEQRRGPKDQWGVTDGKDRRISNLVDGAEKSLGDWNELKVECMSDSIKVWVNNTLVNSGYQCTATHGHIALQAEGAEVEFRKVSLIPK